MRLLVVEDEEKTGDYVRQGLTEAGFVVDLARNGLDGRHLAATGDYDLIVLDVMLPDVDGWSILRSLRSGGSQVPVLFLTARSAVEDRVQGLELGADDYLIKPFAFSELLARVRTLLRRGAAPVNPD
ncbi:MAG: response regulator, partial [Lysobacteraceae bacterium]